ncbi:MAG: histidine kinase [Bacteroidota bacterium]
MELRKMGASIWHFVIRYKLYHLVFWFGYHYFWWAVTSGSATDAMNNIFFSNYSIKFASYVILQALGVYVNLYYLIPRFLKPGKYPVYITLFLSTILLVSFGITGGYFLNAYVTGIPFETLFYVKPEEYIQLWKSGPLSSTVASMTLAMSIKLTKNWIAAEQHRTTVEKEKLETELKFLRSQLNPHFLFNTINSIFVLIHKNQDLASDSLAKFSELLRYQLYHCNEPMITLAKEVEYLENFIELETLRHDTQNLDLQVHLDKTGMGSYGIAPFLLIPFVENAFKHISHFKNQRNWINVGFELKENTLHFSVTNSRTMLQVASEPIKNSGIGLANVERRLELRYPNKHFLEIKQEDQMYSVKLKVQLETINQMQAKIA